MYFVSSLNSVSYRHVQHISYICVFLTHTIHFLAAEEQKASGRATQREKELLRERVSSSLPPPEESRVDNLLFQKSRQEAVVSVSGSQEGMESHGRIKFGPHSSSLSPAGSSGWFESVIKGYSRTLCQIMEAGKRAPHIQTPPRSATGQIPAFHLAALPRVRRWSRWSHLYGVWVPGSCPAVSLAPKDHLTRLCDSVRPASSQVQGHPPHSSEGSRCPCLVRGITVLLAKDVLEPVPPADMKAGFFSPYIIVPKKSGGLLPRTWVCAS